MTEAPACALQVKLPSARTPPASAWRLGIPRHHSRHQFERSSGHLSELRAPDLLEICSNRALAVVSSPVSPIKPYESRGFRGSTVGGRRRCSVARILGAGAHRCLQRCPRVFGRAPRVGGRSSWPIRAHPRHAGRAKARAGRRVHRLRLKGLVLPALRPR